MFHFIGRWAATIGALALVTGCASTAPKVFPEKLGPQEGAVLLKVQSVQRLGVTNGKWSEVTVVEKTTGVVTTLRDLTGIEDEYALFAMPLAAGQYTIRNLGAPGVSPTGMGLLPALAILAMTSDSHDARQGLTGFTVSAGTLTNLGVVVATPPADGEKTIQTAVLSDSRGQEASLADVDATSRRNLAALKTQPAAQAQDLAQQDRALELVRTRATYISPIETTPDGKLLFGSAMGLVHVRSAQGQWTTMSTGTLDALGLVKALPDGRIVAATHRGGYHVWDPATRGWTFRRIAEEGRIVHIEPVGDAGFAMMVRGPFRIGQPWFSQLLFVKDLLDDAPPRESVRLTEMPALGLMPMYFDGREVTVALNHVGITRTADLHRVDPVTLKVRMEKAPHWLARVQRQADGSLIRERMNGMTLYRDLSSDNGATWEELGSSSGTTTPRFSDRLTGLDIRMVSVGMTNSTYSVARTADGGKQWETFGKPFEGGGSGNALQLVVSPTGQPIVFTGAQLLTTTDSGATWTVEWPRPTAVR